jgi:hypothetical protein
MEIGIAVSVGLIVLLAVFSPKIRRAYLKARGEMRAATAKRRAKNSNTKVGLRSSRLGRRLR